MARQANPALLKPMHLSADLEAVIGKGPMSRGEVVKQIWVYIKKHNLQNPKNKRNILADDKLTHLLPRPCEELKVAAHLLLERLILQLPEALIHDHRRHHHRRQTRKLHLYIF